MAEVAHHQDRDEPGVKPRPGLTRQRIGRERTPAQSPSGVLLSRIAGLVRDSIFAHFLGNSAAADAFKAGFRIPNILQNLLGEGVLSASFIPVYRRLLGEGDDETADLLAWAVGAIMTLGVTVLVAIGVLVTPYLIDVIAPGFDGDKRDLTIQIVRILFPGAGLLVMSAWCLGVLNSHHKFFVSYTAPVAWNVAMIATLLYYGPRRSQDGLAIGSRGALWSAPLCKSRCRCRRRSRCCGSIASISRVSPHRCAAVFHNLSPWSSAAASANSAPTSTTCSRACCRPAPSPRSTTDSCSTCCRSACSDFRSRRRSCPRCRARRVRCPSR